MKGRREREERDGGEKIRKIMDGNAYAWICICIFVHVCESMVGIVILIGFLGLLGSLGSLGRDD